MDSLRTRSFFAFFLASGFCGLLYQTVWLRLAMAAFGVTTTVVSVLLAVFMLGLAAGSWLAGWQRLLDWLGGPRRFLRAYAAVELGIGTGAVLVPWFFDLSRRQLLSLGETSSGTYHLVSALLLTASVLPFATLMGATFALALGALRPEPGSERGFSYLYLANVLGAAFGTLVTALVLIELLGFRKTLLVAAVLNGAIAIGARLLSERFEAAAPASVRAPTASTPRGAASSRFVLVALFCTGFVSMAMELVWMRLFARYLGTFVYAFALILATYLVATYVGSRWYRRQSPEALSRRANLAWVSLGVLSLLPLAYADPRFVPHGYAIQWEFPWVLLSVGPFCAVLGFLTPYLVDQHGRGDPGRAARAYAVNVVGCILGPLAAGFVLLPWVGEREALVLLAAVPLGLGLWAALRAAEPERRRVWQTYAVSALLSLVVALGARTYAESIPDGVVRRDATATVVAHGQGMQRGLLVNGVGITSLTTITKVMAHLPLAHLEHRPTGALVICFGMGTTFRSLNAWDIHTVAVELVPSVLTVFPYFFADADEVLSRAQARVVIDDGRRYLDRSRTRFDVITLDPPPPVEAAGSSLLYSRELYRAARRHLRPGGILQQWIPVTDAAVVSSVAQSLRAEFPHVRAFSSMEGWGLHFLASDRPMTRRSGRELAARLPVAARADLTGWLPERSPEDIFDSVMSAERSVDDLIERHPRIAALTDDRPTNEYFLLRRLLGL